MDAMSRGRAARQRGTLRSKVAGSLGFAFLCRRPRCAAALTGNAGWTGRSAVHGLGGWVVAPVPLRVLPPWLALGRKTVSSSRVARAGWRQPSRGLEGASLEGSPFLRLALSGALVHLGCRGGRGSDLGPCRARPLSLKAVGWAPKPWGRVPFSGGPCPPLPSAQPSTHTTAHSHAHTRPEAHLGHTEQVSGGQWMVCPRPTATAVAAPPSHCAGRPGCTCCSPQLPPLSPPLPPPLPLPPFPPCPFDLCLHRPPITRALNTSSASHHPGLGNRRPLQDTEPQDIYTQYR